MTERDQRRRATSTDVAREAGVSRATVSYVLNASPHQKIPEQTRRRVLDAAERLQYAPSVAARALRTGRSDIVLCLLPDWPIGPEVGAILENLSNTLGAQGLTLVTHPRARSATPVAEIWKAIAPAAVLAFESFADSERVAMRARGIEQVVLPVGEASGDLGAVMEIPEERKGRLQVEHLAATGHRRLGYAWPGDERLRFFARPRLRGAQRACAELGLGEPVVSAMPLDAEAAAQIVTSWRSASPPVTGICAYNDEVAFAVLAGAHALGLSVPGELAVIGVDDIPTARVAIPPLTTVATDQQRLAEDVTRVVVNRINGDPDPLRAGPDMISVIRRQSA